MSKSSTFLGVIDCKDPSDIPNLLITWGVRDKSRLHLIAAKRLECHAPFALGLNSGYLHLRLIRLNVAMGNADRVPNPRIVLMLYVSSRQAEPHLGVQAELTVVICGRFRSCFVHIATVHCDVCQDCDASYRQALSPGDSAFFQKLTSLR